MQFHHQRNEFGLQLSQMLSRLWSPRTGVPTRHGAQLRRSLSADPSLTVVPPRVKNIEYQMWKSQVEITNKPSLRKVVIQVHNISLGGVGICRDAFAPSRMDGYGVSNPHVSTWANQAELRIICFTHTDLVADGALRQVAADVIGKLPNVPVFFLNMNNSTNAYESMRPLIDGLVLAGHIVGTDHLLVCGLPNSGKTTLVKALTRHQHKLLRKSGAYLKSKNDQIADTTSNVITHVLKSPLLSEEDKTMYVLDSPGIRPPVRLLHRKNMSLLYASATMQYYKPVDLARSVKMIHKALIAYRLTLGMTIQEANDTAFSPALPDFVTNESQNLVSEEVDLFVHQAKNGVFGGLAFWHVRGVLEARLVPLESLHISREVDSPIVAMSPAAELLLKYGTESEEAPNPGKKALIRKEAKKALDAVINLSSRDSSLEQEGVCDEEEVEEPAPLEQKRKKIEQPGITCKVECMDLECMKCAGLVGSTAGATYFGKRLTYVQNWKDEDISQLYSRFLVYWPNQSYLLRDSLACSLMMKYKLTSRRKVYKMFKSGKSSNLLDFPIPNRQRQYRFRDASPLPDVSKWTCRKLVAANQREEKK